MNRKTWFQIAGLVVALNLALYGLVPFVRNAYATSLKVWSQGEVVKYSDLNGNFQTVNNATLNVAQVVDANVSATAAIAHSKLKTPALVPKAWAFTTGGDCASSPCTIGASSGVTSITRTGTGVYVVTWTTTRADNLYAVLVTAQSTAGKWCMMASGTTSAATINCYTATASAADVALHVMLMDNDN